MKKKSGFTILEVLLSGAMVLIVLGLVAGVAKGYAEVDKATQFGERARILMRATLTEMMAEAQGAYAMASPTNSTLVSELAFSKVDPTTNAARFPALPVPPDPFPTSWNPTPSTSERTLRYTLSGDEVVAEDTRPSGSTLTTVVFKECSGFECRLLTGNILEVSLSTQKDRRVIGRTERVHLPCL